MLGGIADAAALFLSRIILGRGTGFAFSVSSVWLHIAPFPRVFDFPLKQSA